MIFLPKNYSDGLQSDFSLRQRPGRTWRLRFDGKPGSGMLDGTEAIRQMICMTLAAERFRYEMFSWNYGVELADCFGQNDSPLLRAKLQRAVCDALEQDDRVREVTDFRFAIAGRRALRLRFTVQTDQGGVESEALWTGDGLEVSA